MHCSDAGACLRLEWQEWVVCQEGGEWGNLTCLRSLKSTGQGRLHGTPGASRLQDEMEGRGRGRRWPP